MTISVVIPVLHEQAGINVIVAHLQEQGAENPEIIVVDGDPAGSTLSAVIDPHVVKRTAPKGRGNQLAAGARIAAGDILLLLHADTRLPEAALKAVRQAVSSGAAWGAFRLGIDAPETAFRIIERSVDLRCRLFSLPYGDQAMFVTRTALERIGGIPELPLMEDVALARRLKKAGCRFALLSGRVATSARRWRKDGILRRTLKNWWLLSRYLAGDTPENLTKNYR